MNRLIPLLILILFATLSRAQNTQGYVVLESGDTLKGIVKLLDGYRSAPQLITLEASGAASAPYYSVKECKAFAIGDDEYIRATVTMDMSYFTSIDLTILYEDSTLTQTVFLKRIYKGKNISLLKYYDGQELGAFRAVNVKMHFFVQDADKVQELIMKYTNAPTKSVVRHFDVDRGSSAMRQIRPIFRDQLRMYFDWLTEKKLLRKLDGSDYTEYHLLKLIPLIDQKFSPIVSE